MASNTNMLFPLELGLRCLFRNHAFIYKKVFFVNCISQTIDFIRNGNLVDILNSQWDVMQIFLARCIPISLNCLTKGSQTEMLEDQIENIFGFFLPQDIVNKTIFVKLNKKYFYKKILQKYYFFKKKYFFKILDLKKMIF